MKYLRGKLLEHVLVDVGGKNIFLNNSDEEVFKILILFWRKFVRGCFEGDV